MQNNNKKETSAPRGIKKHFDIHPPVFWSSSILLILFIAITIIMGDRMEAVFNNIQNWISDNFGWFLIILVNVYLFFTI
ncbi:MAG: BCCT family transporter, partial [Bacteroidota bacterium]